MWLKLFYRIVQYWGPKRSQTLSLWNRKIEEEKNWMKVRVTEKAEKIFFKSYSEFLDPPRFKLLSPKQIILTVSQFVIGTNKITMFA